MNKLWKIYGDDQTTNDHVESKTSEPSENVFNNPVVILNEFANQVYDDTDSQFRGMVTESTQENSNEVTYALYIVARELNDYMYRLIEVNVPNIIQPFPLEVKLFAKDPRNHRTFYCEGVAEFRKTLIDLISSPVTKVILKHLVTLIEINQNSTTNTFSFKLTDSEPTKIFYLKSELPPITIKRIVLSSHIGNAPNEWGKLISNSIVSITITNTIKKNSFQRQVSLVQFLSLYQAQPVLELKLVLPDYKFYTENKLAELEIKFTLNTTNIGVHFDFFYDSEFELETSKTL